MSGRMGGLADRRMGGFADGRWGLLVVGCRSLVVGCRSLVVIMLFVVCGLLHVFSALGFWALGLVLGFRAFAPDPELARCCLWMPFKISNFTVFFVTLKNSALLLLLLRS